MDERVLRVLFESRIFELRDIQKEAIQQGLFFRKSFLVCAPSGSGKTLIGELCAIHNIFQKFGKSIYLVPFKALATEKYFSFKKSYERFGIKIELSIGDYDVDDDKLAEADIIVTTYEKCDSLLRNFHDKEWIFDISTIIIDEIHMIGESGRGPRLESLIVRLNEFLHNPQIIGLSATIANPEFFNTWLTSLKNTTQLIFSEKRPVPLHYRIQITQNKDATIKKYVNSTLEEKGQVLVFLTTRKKTQQEAIYLKTIVSKYLVDAEIKALKEIENKIAKIKGHNKDLRKVIGSGVSFHHAGLLPKEKKLIEDAYRDRLVKVICCTTTLSAGVNIPARLVILKDFKKFQTPVDNIRNFSGYHESEGGFTYFKPFSANETFQMLGRAGRPGLDSVGHGIILVSNMEERSWVEENYFENFLHGMKPIPKYNDLTSGLNGINTLKEQVLLRIYEERGITLEKLKTFFERTYFWYCMRAKMRSNLIPIDQLLMIKPISPINILKLHSDPRKVKQLKESNHSIKISNISNSNIAGYIKTNYGVYTCSFDLDAGIHCSCGFKNEISDNFVSQEFSFEFCDHITAFLIHLLGIHDVGLQKYVEDIVPRSVKNQFILNYLHEKGLIVKNNDGTIVCSHFGKLIIRLYLYPVSGVLIRDKLENSEINSFQDLIKESYEILKAEGRVRDYKMLQPILDWTDEEPVDTDNGIIQRYNIMTGDLFSTRDGLERIVMFVGIIASHLSENNFEMQDKLGEIAVMCETLRTRLHYGVKAELFDLVLRIENVARVRARILFDAGYHTAKRVAKEKPYILNQKTGLGLKLCKRIIEGLNKKPPSKK